jgi:iron complex transport system ATP-binding protein
MIRCTKLCVCAGQTLAVRDVDLALLPGRVTAVLGPNGAGKSSLVRAISGIIAPRSGAITIDGEALSGLEARERARKIGYLPQNGHPAWNVTARELVSLGRLPFRSPFAAATAEDSEAVDEALAATDCLHLATRTIDQMSGGERARVLLARVLAGRPRWIIADEPLANLDPPHQHDVLDRLRAAAAHGTGIILVLHQINAAARAADDAILMAEGRVIAHGTVAETLEPARLETAFGMPFRRVADGEGFLIAPGR